MFRYFFYLSFALFSIGVYGDIFQNSNQDILTNLQELEDFFDAMKPVEEKRSGVFAWFTGIDDPNFNVVMNISSEKDIEKKVDSLIYQAPYGNLCFWVHDLNRSKRFIKTLRRRRFKSVAICPLMTWPVEHMELPNYNIEPADSEIFHEIVSDVFHFDKWVEEEYAELLETAKAENYLIYYEGEPAGAGTLLFRDKIGGIFNIATIPRFRRKGLASAMIQFLMKRAEILGLEKVTLLSSPAAKKLYLDLGFTKCFDIEVYSR